MKLTAGILDGLFVLNRANNTLDRIEPVRVDFERRKREPIKDLEQSL